MTERTIPIADLRYHARFPAIPETPAAPVGLLTDTRGRRLHDLRISVTDRCNFRCTYCMPKSVFDKDYAFLPQSLAAEFRGDHPTDPACSSATASRKSASPAANRCCASTSKRSSSSWPASSPRGRCARSHPDHQRLAAAQEGGRPEGGGPEPRDGQPRRARRQGLQAHERRRFPGRRSARGHRGSRSRRLQA